MHRFLALFDEQRFHRWFIAAALLLAVFGGFTLAVALAVDGASGYGFGERWVPLAQAHGHLQVVGFLGLIVIGVGLRLAPRFANTHLRAPGLIGVVLLVLIVAVVLRAAGQALADQAAWRVVMVTGAWLELLGGLLVAAAILITIRRGLRQGVGPLWFFAAGCVWFVAQAVLGAIWLTDAALDDRTVLATTRNSALLLIQIFGFLLSFFLGVALQALPTFFGRRPARPRPVLATFAVVQAGLLLTAISLIVWDIDGSRQWAVEDAGYSMLGAGLLGAAYLCGVWGAPVRLRPAVRPAGRLPQLAVGWLAVAAGLLIFFAVRAASEERGLPAAETDAVRHLIALGVLVMAIVGMAHLVLPELAVERLAGSGMRTRAWIFGMGLSVVAAMRAAPGIVDDGLPSAADFWHMASAGIIALVLVALFGWIFLRATRHQPTLLLEVAQRVSRLARDSPDAAN